MNRTEDDLYAYKAMHKANVDTAIAMKSATAEFQTYVDNFQLVAQRMDAFQVNLNKDFGDIHDAVVAHWALIRENMVELHGNVNRVLQVYMPDITSHDPSANRSRTPIRLSRNWPSSTNNPKWLMDKPLVQ